MLFTPYLEYFYETALSYRIFLLNLRSGKFILESQITDILILNLTRVAGRFKLVVGNQEFEQNTCEFLLTFASMQGKNMDEYMCNLSNDYDRVRIPLSGCGLAVTLPLCDFARLRSLYGQRMFDLKLEDLLMRQGITSAEQFIHA